MGDLNAKVGENGRHQIGKFGFAERNESGDRLAEFCHVNNLVITNTLFDHHERNLYTWISPGDRYRNQIDYIMTRRRWKSSICKTFPGADCDTDHILLAAKIRVKLSRIKSKPRPKKVDLKELEDPETRTSFKARTSQRFKEHLIRLENGEAEETTEPLWAALSTILSETADQTLGKCKRKPKKLWISSEVLKLAEEKSNFRKKKRANDQEQRYKDMMSEIQRKIRKDKAAWLEDRCQQIKKDV